MFIPTWGQFMEKMFDLAEIEAIANGDAAFIKEFMLANIESMQEAIDNMAMHFSSGNLDELGKAAHKIKPILAMLHTGALHQAVVDTEHFSRKQIEPERVADAYNVVKIQLPLLLEQLKKEVS